VNPKHLLAGRILAKMRRWNKSVPGNISYIKWAIYRIRDLVIYNQLAIYFYNISSPYTQLLTLCPISSLLFGPYSKDMSPSVTLKISPNLQDSPSTGEYRGYDHATFYVGNAKQAASWYSARMGFRIVAQKSLETGSRAVASWVVANGQARFVFMSPLRAIANLEHNTSEHDRKLVAEIHKHLEQHGDAVKDVAFEVDDVRAIYSNAIAQGAASVKAPECIQDENGSVYLATIKTYGDTTHTFVERQTYTGVFLPGYRAVDYEDPIEQFLPKINIDVIDHCVGNQDWYEMDNACN